MKNSDIKAVLKLQKDYFATGATRSVEFRFQQLAKMKDLLKRYETKILTAVEKDLKRPVIQTFMGEISIIHQEIKLMCKNVKKWSMDQSVPVPLLCNWPIAKSFVRYEPYGSVLIISPWNYPILLTFLPLIGAIAAGNCAILKPSEISSHVEEVICELINDNFQPEYVIAIKADANETMELLKERYDYIFFTGSTVVGKAVALAAANHLTPITLELGGKNPAIVDETADLDFSARRIVNAKFINSGQTCIAPDYIYVHAKHRDVFISKLIKTIEQFFTNDPANSQDYSRIINSNHYDRLTKLLKSGKIVYGGQTIASANYIAPTIITEIDWESPIMQTEIFGPILPIMYYDNIKVMINTLNASPTPLSLYLFTKDRRNEGLVLDNVAFGGGCVNDCLLHFLNGNLPFGGRGNSGMGSYHGKKSFETFSHAKSIYKNTYSFDASFLYPPFEKIKQRIFRMLL